MDIEPILIDFDGDKWEHPFITTLAFNFTTPSEINYGCFDGNLLRIWLQQENNTAHIVAVVNDEIYNDVESSIDHIADYLSVLLHEDCWCPGEQFCFTEFGKKMSVFTDFSFEVSPDICIHYDGPSEGWNWSS
ncbi:hypothetical protein NCTGTJJY_CDS0144 [Serratia phage 92A1]|nr:hypothetical protein NCTGTJJY_CDS0144 [Serratia phage 92A1]